MYLRTASYSQLLLSACISVTLAISSVGCASLFKCKCTDITPLGSTGVVPSGGASNSASLPVAASAVIADQAQIFAPEAQNSLSVQASPYVILVSIDGYRYDYNQKYQPPNLSQLAKDGVTADALLPVYPSKTFPNHYSIATGLYTSHHGIVSNEFYAPKRDAVYSLPDRKAVTDGSWYGGLPLWVAVEKQGGIAASYFWVGSEAEIAGYRPNFYFLYNQATSDDARVAQVLEWLKLSPEKRPHFISMYFSGVDSAGHESGPDSEQTREAVLKVDAAIGKLRAGLQNSKLPVNIIVVSDHGMEAIDLNKTIVLDETAALEAKLSKFIALGRGPQMLLYLDKSVGTNASERRRIVHETKLALEQLAKKRGGVFRVRAQSELKELHYEGNDRVGDLVIEPDAPWSVGLKKQTPFVAGGNHGWNPQKTKNMGGIFYASGPAFKEHYQVHSFENINVYPLVLDILGMKPLTPIDGDLAVTKEVLH
jgi:hypothetical protein